jgi:hypothetical protein
MYKAKSNKNSHISVDCIKACPYIPNLFALAYYQTNPTTMGAISVTKINTPNDINTIEPI